MAFHAEDGCFPGTDSVPLASSTPQCAMASPFYALEYLHRYLKAGWFLFFVIYLTGLLFSLSWVGFYNAVEWAIPPRPFLLFFADRRFELSFFYVSASGFSLLKFLVCFLSACGFE